MSIKLELEPQEVASIIEALHDGILRRLAWTTSTSQKQWRGLPILTVQLVMDSMLSSYAKAVMSFRETEDIQKDERFEGAFSFNEEVWDMLDQITKAKTWDDVELHPFHSEKGECAACDNIYGRL